MVDVNKVIQDNKTTKFIIQNISPEQKTVNIFNYPITAGHTRDILSIPGISEADIRFSLLKGEILLKLLAHDIRVFDTNIDLLQFDTEHKIFLKNSGVAIGTEVGMNQLTEEVQIAIETGGSGLAVEFHQNKSLIGTKNGSNRVFFTPDKFIEGSYLGSEFAIEIRHNGRVLDPSVDYATSESGGFGTGFDTITFLSFAPTSFSSLLVNYVSRI
jgi:hypothetical protein